jgi:hypothetical protein
MSSEKSNAKIHEFYFTINGQKKGPFFSCPCVTRELAVNFAFAKYFKQMLKGMDKLGEKFSSRKSIHDKIMGSIFKNKKPSPHPTCKFIITPEFDIDKFRDMETSTSIVLNFNLIAKLLPEKKENEVMLNNARKTESNYTNLIKFNDLCTEEQSYLFLLAFYKASQLRIDIILTGMYYMEPFELAVVLFNKCNYENLEIYMIDTEESYVDKMLNDNKPEEKYQDFMYKSCKNIFELIIHDKSFLISRKPKIYRNNLSDFLKTKQANPVDIEVIEKELKKNKWRRSRPQIRAKQSDI